MVDRTSMEMAIFGLACGGLAMLWQAMIFQSIVRQAERDGPRPPIDPDEFKRFGDKLRIEADPAYGRRLVAICRRAAIGALLAAGTLAVIWMAA